jgi:hypothetical protein
MEMVQPDGFRQGRVSPAPEGDGFSCFKMALQQLQVLTSATVCDRIVFVTVVQLV